VEAGEVKHSEEEQNNSPRSDSGAYARPQKMKNPIFVMPARIAGIQARKEASGDIHVNLDSSTPCWNDAIDGFCLN
jgi:hypothetical protein